MVTIRWHHVSIPYWLGSKLRVRLLDIVSCVVACFNPLLVGV